MQIEKHEEGAWRPVWIDWILLLAFAAILFMGVRYLLERKQSALPDISVEYVICLSEQKQSYAEENGGWEAMLPSGITVSNANGTANMGRVASVTVRPHLTATVKNKEVGVIERQGYVDLYITVHGMAVRLAGEGLRISDIRIAAGEKGDFLIGAFFAGNAVVVSVKEGAA